MSNKLEDLSHATQLVTSGFILELDTEGTKHSMQATAATARMEDDSKVATPVLLLDEPKQNQQATTHNSLNINFIRRLFACGGQCARSDRRGSNSMHSSSSNYGLSKSTTAIQIKSPKLSTAQGQEPVATVARKSTFNKIDSFHSELHLNQVGHVGKHELTTPAPLISNNTSYESIVDKVDKPTASKNTFKAAMLLKHGRTSKVDEPKPRPALAPTKTQRKILLNENLKKIENQNHKLFKNSQNSVEESRETINTITSSVLVLPVLKVNDNVVAGSPNLGKDKVVPQEANTDEESNNEEEYEDEEEDDEEDDDDDDEDDEEDEDELDEEMDTLEREMLKALRCHQQQHDGGYDDDFANHDLDELDETEENFNLYCGYAEHEEEESLYDEKQQQQQRQIPKSRIQKAKLKANEHTTNPTILKHNSSHRQLPALVAYTETRPKSVDEEDELIDSNKYFNSLQHFQLTSHCSASGGDLNSFKNSISNYSFKNSSSLFKSDKNGSESLTSADNGANLFVLLAANRKKQANLNDSKTLIGQSDEKLSKQDTRSPLKASPLLSTGNSVPPSVSLNGNFKAAPRLEQDNFMHRSYQEPMSAKGNRPNENSAFLSTSVSTTNTSDSYINTLGSLQLPKSLLHSMSQVSSNYSMDKSASMNVKQQQQQSVVNILSPKKASLSKQQNNIDIEESEVSDVLNEIFKVNEWLKDNNNHHRNRNILGNLNDSVTNSAQLLRHGEYISDRSMRETHTSIDTTTTATTTSTTTNTNASMVRLNFEENEDDDDYDTERENNKVAAYKNNDSAIEISSYGFVEIKDIFILKFIISVLQSNLRNIIFKNIYIQKFIGNIGV